jgi:ABC-type transport system involved in multi-copper enzyme maturation permease subunit
MPGPILELARHELAVTLRTRRAIAVIGIYIASAVIAGLGYSASVSFVERAVANAKDMNPEISNQIDIFSEPAYNAILAFVAGAELSEIAPALRESPIVPFVLWGSLRFLPLLILLTSFDLIAGEMASRSLAYTTLRASRTEVVLGKALGHVTLLLMLSALCGILSLAIAAAILESVSFVASLPGLLYVLALLVPFGACYLGITVFCSAVCRQPFIALVCAFAAYLAVWIVRAFAAIPETDSAWALLRPLAWVSPATYQSGLWRADPVFPLTSLSIHLMIAAIMLGAAALVLRRRAI